MCQLIAVTRFIWKLSADQIIVLLDRDQCSISYFLVSLGAQLIMHTCWTSMLWSIDSWQNRASADQYHISVSLAQVSIHRSQVFFEVIRWQVTSFQMIAGSSLIFLIHMKYVVFMCRTIKILISNWPGTRKFSQLLQPGKTVAFAFALVTLYVQFLCSDWSKFDRWVHTENLCRILNIVYFDSSSWQSFMSTCDVFTCLFPLDAQNEIQLLVGVFCYS